MTRESIRRQADWLVGEVASAERVLHGRKSMLADLQEKCSHPMRIGNPPRCIDCRQVEEDAHDRVSSY